MFSLVSRLGEVEVWGVLGGLEALLKTEFGRPWIETSSRENVWRLCVVIAHVVVLVISG
jgi:hypothetical protein